MDLNAKPTFFASSSEFRKWLEKNHQSATELLVGFYKVGTGKPSMTWSASVDQALCFGWIDGIRKSIDQESYLIRFTPRKPTSIWSAINIDKVETLTQKGLMHPAGLASFLQRKEHKSAIYTYETGGINLSPRFEKEFRLHQKAWAFFQSMPPSYQKPAINWVMSAKQEATQLKRLNQLISDCEEGRKIKPLNY